MRRVLSYAFIVLLSATLGVLPGAGAPAPADEGTVWGTMSVGKYGGWCTNSGDASLHGPGLGTIADGPKNLHWEISAGTGTHIGGAFTFNWCGTMGPSKGLGAACEIHSGTGRGTVPSPRGGTTWIKFAWSVSVGGLIPATGQATIDSNSSANGKKPHDGADFAMLMTISGGPGCFTKADDGGGAKIGGEQDPDMIGAWEISP